MIKKNLSQLVQEQEEILLAPIGTSMKPLLYPNRDIVCLKKLQENPKKYDIVLYQRNDGSYILHRIMNIKKECYELCGDNQIYFENGITRKQMLAKVVYFYRGNKTIYLNCLFYQFYILIWCKLFFIRKIIFYILKKRRI